MKSEFTFDRITARPPSYYVILNDMVIGSVRKMQVAPGGLHCWRAQSLTGDSTDRVSREAAARWLKEHQS